MSRYVVTGSSSGIGRETAQMLSDAGHEVIGWDLYPDVSLGYQQLEVDIADDSSVEQAASAVGELDGLLNVAGIPGTAPAETVIFVNVLGTLRVTDALVDLIARGGSILTVASIAAARSAATDAELDLVLSGDRNGIADLGLDSGAAYDTAKKALLRWNRNLTLSLLPRGIRCCTVSPGPVETPILDDFRRSMGGSVERSEQILKRNGSAREVASALVFLASDQASWINGVDLRVDGGLMTIAEVSAEPSTH